MISALISILVLLLILVVVWYIARIAITTFGGPAPLLQIIGLILLLIFIIAALSMLGLLDGHWRLRP